MPVGVDQQAELPLLELAERVDAAQLRRRRERASAATRRDLARPDSIRGRQLDAARHGMPATRASATVAASCRLPKRSTQVTSVRRQARPSRRRPSSTTPPIRRTNDAGSIGSPSSSSAAPVQSAATAGANSHARRRSSLGRAAPAGAPAPPRGRPAPRPPPRPRPRAARCRARRTTRTRRRAARPAGRCPGAPCRPRVDDAEHHAGPQMRHRPHQRVAPRPDVEGRDVMGQVDDGRPRCAGRNDRVDHAGELVLGAEVGEEEDGARGLTRHGSVLSAAGCAIARWRPPPPP